MQCYEARVRTIDEIGIANADIIHRISVGSSFNHDKIVMKEAANQSKGIFTSCCTTIKKNGMISRGGIG